MSFARGGWVGEGADVEVEARERLDLVRLEDMGKDRLRLLRDGLIEALSGVGLTQAQIGYVFNRHPEHVGRIMRAAPEGLVESVHAILSGRVPPAGTHPR